ncbi:MAG: PH domain-containing protein [Tyzzerella sp.]|nr:PH domain-containing protein [Tyzzerella sp.]
MQKNVRFRNHISVIFENTIRSIGVIVFIFIGNFITSMDEMEDMGEHTTYLVLVLVGFLAVLLIWQIFVWAKTYISIQENTLIVERNTLNKKRNTIGLKNISNVNLEQNLLEMILGTCKVKLDTNSLSTADQTDVNIILKKKDAEAFRQLILHETNPEAEAEEQAAQGEQRKFVSGMDDIVIHGLFSINFFSLIVLVGVVAGAIGTFSELTLEDVEGGLFGMLFSILVSIWVLGGMLWSVVKGFVKYIDFKIERKKDKISLSYGLFKKVAYSIPVDKINAVRFTQTMLARIGKRYMVEIINVGIDDDENEAQFFFLPYAKKSKIEEQIRMLLPEFDGCLELGEEKQPKSIWLIWIPKVVLYFAVMGVVFGIMMEFIPEAKLVLLAAIGIISVLALISKIAAFLTIGTAVHKQFLEIVDGSIGRRILFVKYDKIQYVTAKQNVLAKNFRVQKGEIYLLAAIKNQVHSLPYFREEEMERLKDSL